MAPTPGNVALLEKLNEGNRALIMAEIQALDPMLRGAGDASFVAPFWPFLTASGLPEPVHTLRGKRAELCLACRCREVNGLPS